jgi:Asp-tRNA(Asn)/Glu-tRNA(Gln) amidotransferase A subunit family amidase
MTQTNPSIRSQAPMGRREWIISSLLTSGLVASMSQAQALAVCLPIDQETQDPPLGKNPAPRNQLAEITSEMVRQASWQSRVELTDAHCEEIAKRLSAKAKSIQALRTASIEENTPMASVFLPAAFVEPATRFGHLQIANPAPGQSTGDPNTRRLSELELPKFDPDTLEQVAFWTVEQLAAGLRRKLFTSEQLTAMYTERLKKYDPQLLCVVSYNQDAIESAKRADELLASGKDLGILHGIPWGAKDIISIPGMPTTWGAVDYKDRLRETMATVAEKIESAGAVLLAKLTVGTLAWGDQWFGGMTRNPWDIEQGSSGSSAGSACAVVAGLCGFAIGSETLGSIVSPTRVCSTCGLRPSFGRVSRYGCMTLGWTMDKIGPIGRTPRDCGLIFSKLLGSDGKDPSVFDAPFEWPIPDWSIKKLRFGVSSRPRGSERTIARMLTDEGAEVIELDFEPDPRIQAMTDAISVEAAAMHSELFESIQEDDQVGKWAPTFREAQFCSAIDYVQAMRARVALIQKTEQVLRQVDVYLGDGDLARMNLTGHPSMVVSFGEDVTNKKPKTLVLTSRFFHEPQLLMLADWIQRKLPPTPSQPELTRIL